MITALSKKEKVTGLVKDNLGGEIVIKIVGLRAKTYIYLVDDSSKDKQTKALKKCIIKRKLKFEITKTV